MFDDIRYARRRTCSSDVFVLFLNLKKNLRFPFSRYRWHRNLEINEIYVIMDYRSEVKRIIQWNTQCVFRGCICDYSHLNSQVSSIIVWLVSIIFLTASRLPQRVIRNIPRVSFSPLSLSYVPMARTIRTNSRILLCCGGKIVFDILWILFALADRRLLGVSFLSSNGSLTIYLSSYSCVTCSRKCPLQVVAFSDNGHVCVMRSISPNLANWSSERGTGRSEIANDGLLFVSFLHSFEDYLSYFTFYKTEFTASRYLTAWRIEVCKIYLRLREFKRLTIPWTQGQSYILSFIECVFVQQLYL